MNTYRLSIILLLSLATKSFAAGNCVGSLLDFIKSPMAPLCSKDKGAPVKDEGEVTEDTGPSGPGSMMQGKVLQTFDAAGYTYLEIETGAERVWLATRRQAIKIGDIVAFNAKTPYENFYSATLKRSFEQIYLVDDLEVNAPTETAEVPAATAATSLAPRATLAEIIQNRLSLKGQTLAVSGKVVKANDHIMGLNWVHIVDHSLNEATQNLALTTTAAVKVGDTITATGILAVDKNLGSGYFFPALIEHATIKVKVPAKVKL